MARPKTLDDIKVADEIEFASVDVTKIANRGDLLKAYGEFMEAIQKAGCRVDVRYNSASFVRPPSQAELDRQLSDAQASWDEKQDCYRRWAAGEELEYEFQYDRAKQHAHDEGLPLFPWEKEGRLDADLDDTLSAIDELEKSS